MNISTTNNLPHLFYIEDNGYGISVPQEVQTPGGDQVANLAAYKQLHIVDGDGTDPLEAASKIKEAVEYVRSGKGCCLLRLRVPRLCGHTFQDTQTYKPAEMIEAEQAKDPLPKLKQFMLDNGLVSETHWSQIEERVEAKVRHAIDEAMHRPEPDPGSITRYVYSENDESGQSILPTRGGLAAQGHTFPDSSEEAKPEGAA